MVCFLSPACLDRAIEMPVTAVTVNDREGWGGGQTHRLGSPRYPANPTKPEHTEGRLEQIKNMGNFTLSAGRIHQTPAKCCNPPSSSR